MRTVAIVSIALLLSACGKQKIIKIERQPEAPPASGNTVLMPDGTRAEVVIHKKHPMYAIIETEPRNEYERKLPMMMSKVINVDALQQFCGQWYPDYGHDVAEAYMAWRKQHEATIKEITGRSEAVWAEYAGEDVAYVRMVYPHLRKQMRAAIDKEFDRSPAEKFKQVCAGLPADLRSSKWDLEKRHKTELAFLRETPFPGNLNR